MRRREFLFWLSAFYLNLPVWAKDGQFAWLDLETNKFYGENAFGRIGSLAKLITATALLQTKAISSEQIFECRQTYKNYNCQIAHGKINLEQAIGFSCNVYFAQAVCKLSFEGLATSFQQFTKQSLKFSGGQIQDYALGLHKNLSLNSSQILQMFAMIARSNNYLVLKQGLKLAVRQGTAKNLDRANILDISAKTGTITEAKDGPHFESWVAGYFPSENPKYCFCLKAKNGTSQESAIPLAHHELFSRKWF